MARLKKAYEKKTKKAPVLKHVIVAKKVSDNVGNVIPTGKRVTMERAMIDAGYSDSYAKSGHIKNTDSWQTLMESAISDSELMVAHKRLLNKNTVRTMQFYWKITDSEIQELIESAGFTFVGVQRFMASAVVKFLEPDAFAQNAALDKAYKLKKKYGAIVIKHRFGELSDEDLEREASREISEALGLASGEEAEGN